MVEHYTDDCRFHAVSCPNCNGKVLHLEIINHLESRRPPPTSPSQQARDENLVNATLEVKKSLRSASENCTCVERKLESFEERLANYRDDSVAALARMIAARPCRSPLKAPLRQAELSLGIYWINTGIELLRRSRTPWFRRSAQQLRPSLRNASR